MTRVKYAVARHHRKNRLMKNVKGFRGGRSKLYRTAKETYKRALAYAFEGRKLKKRNFRRLWIIRINAACRQRGIRYSVFMNGLKKHNITINRKYLSEIAIHEPAGFDKIVELAMSN